MCDNMNDQDYTNINARETLPKTGLVTRLCVTQCVLFLFYVSHNVYFSFLNYHLQRKPSALKSRGLDNRMHGMQSSPELCAIFTVINVRSIHNQALLVLD